MIHPLMIALFFLALGASCLFSGMEAGVMSLNRLRIRQLKRKGDPRAELLNGFLEQPERFLWTIVVGNTLANFVAAFILVHFLRHQWTNHPWQFGLTFIATVFLLFYGLCDLLPKMAFRLFPTRLCLLTARLFRLVNLLLRPVVDMVTWVAQGLAREPGKRAFAGTLFRSREELRMFVQESTQNLTSEERNMITRVLDLQNRTVQHVAIPIDQAITVTASTPMAQVMEICREKNLTRLPVWHGEGLQKRIIGVLSLRSALYREDFRPEGTAENYLRPALYLDEDTRLEVALTRLQRAGERQAILLDSSRKETGLVCLQDILKTIFGEVRL
jgi:putative hemolysin